MIAIILAQVWAGFWIGLKATLTILGIACYLAWWLHKHEKQQEKEREAFRPNKKQ